MIGVWRGQWVEGLGESAVGDAQVVSARINP